jgi:hypothetical protein
MRKLRLALLGLVSLGATQAKDKPKAFYAAGTLSVRQGTPAQLKYDDREFSVAWKGKPLVLHVSYRKILFIEAGSYRPKPVLGEIAFNSSRVLEFMTMIYQDDWNNTAVLQLQLEGGYRTVPGQIGSASKIPVHDAYADVTALAKAYGVGLPTTEHKVKFLSATTSGKHAGAAASLKLTPSGPEVTVRPDRKLILYSNITSLEYGQTVGINARTLIPLTIMTEGYAALLLRKRVRHLLSVTYLEDGVPEVMVLELSKYSARALIIELELRSGKRVEFNSKNAADNIYG